MGRQPAYNKEELLRRIIDCLWKQGYASTPVSALTKQTGVNAASLYAVFGSKKGIMLASLAAYAAETFAELRALLARTPQGAARARAVLAHALEVSMGDPRARGCFLVNSVIEASPDEPEFTAAVADAMAVIRDILEEALTGSADLRLDISPKEAALFLQNQIWGIKLMARLNPPRERQLAHGQAIIRQTLRALFTPEAVRLIEKDTGSLMEESPAGRAEKETACRAEKDRVA